MTILYIFLLSVISGILGRMGGAEGYDTLYRDIGCSLISLLVLLLLLGFQLSFWWVYIIIFGLSWGALSTYWDKLFKFDNLFFSGFMAGLVFIPIGMKTNKWIGIGIRSILLALIWGSLNKYLPKKIKIFKWEWTRDIVEEFLRYASLVATIPLVLI